MIGEDDSKTIAPAVPLRKWLWRSYVKAALVPMLLIEFSFIGIY